MEKLVERLFTLAQYPNSSWILFLRGFSPIRGCCVSMSRTNYFTLLPASRRRLSGMAGLPVTLYTEPKVPAVLCTSESIM